MLLELLEPKDTLIAYEEAGNFYARLGLLEQLKSMPFGAVWDEFCLRAGVPCEMDIIESVLAYEKEVLKERL